MQKLEIDSERSLFVISQIGQLKTAEKLVRDLQIDHVSLVILFTQKNIVMPTVTQASADPELFGKIKLVEISPYSNDFDNIAIRGNLSVYRKTLDEFSPRHVFVCSFERHYALLCEEVKRRGVELSLFEEGTSILKYTVEGFQTFQSPTVRSSLGRIYKKYWEDQPLGAYVARPIYIASRQIIQLPSLLFRTFRDVIQMPIFQYGNIEKRHHGFIHGWREFDKVFSTQPDTVSTFFPSADCHELPVHFDDVEEIALAKEVIAEYDVDRRTIVFASQRYGVDPKVLCPLIVMIIARIAKDEDCKVVIKLHPSEADRVILQYKAAIRRLGVSKLISVMEGIHVPAEYIAIYSQCPVVAAISSSTLMYAPKAKNGLRAISIGDMLLKELAIAGVQGRGTTEISDHTKIISQLSYVEKYGEMVRSS